MFKVTLKSISLLVFIFLMTGYEIFSQSNISTPYSAYGLGQFSDANNTRNKSMGGIGIGTRDYFTVNLLNPASFTAFDSISFVFEGAVYGHYTTLNTTDLSEKTSSISFGHILMGFPVTNWWRSSIALLPYSEMSYNVNDNIYNDDIGSTQFVFEGEGGLSKLNWGNAIRPIENFSFGINASYIFGTLDRVNKVAFPDSLFMINTLNNNILSIRDIDLEFGAQFHKEIKEKYDIVIGATYHPETQLKTIRNNMVRSYQGTIGTYELIIDTIRQDYDENGSITYPQMIGVGFSIANGFKWMFGFDYKFEEWESFESYGSYDSLTNRHNFKFGGHYLPNSNSSSYANRIDYRLGAHYDLSHLSFRNEHLKGFGITFGLGLPIRSNALRGSRSMLNIGFEYGKMGTTAKDLIEEDYFKVNLSATIFERWFIKRRYR